MTLSVLAGMANANWPEEDAYTYLCDRGNVGGRFLQSLHMRNPGRARSWLHRQYQDALEWTATHPSHDPLEDTYLLAQMQTALEGGEGLSRGQAGVTERAVLRVLVGKGLEYSSVIVRASLRHLSEQTCASVSTVHRVINRLQGSGWLEVYERAQGYQATSYRLQRPGAGKLITEVPLCTGGKGTPVPKLPTQVDPLFASTGLGRGTQETFAQLPLRSRRVKGLVALAVDKRLPREVTSPPVAGHRWSLPKAPRGDGRTATEIADAVSKSAETVRRHLRRLEQAHMAYRDDRGRWYRYYFDPPSLAAYLQVPDTPALLRERYVRDRDGFFAFLVTPKGRAIYGAKVAQQVEGQHVRYVDERNGLVLHSAPSTYTGTSSQKVLARQPPASHPR